MKRESMINRLVSVRRRRAMFVDTAKTKEPSSVGASWKSQLTIGRSLPLGALASTMPPLWGLLLCGVVVAINKPRLRC